MSQPLTAPYWRRFLTALCAAAGLVFACSLSMQSHVLKEPEWVLAVAGGVVIASLPGALISALAFRRNQLALILGAQVPTVVALFAWFWLKA